MEETIKATCIILISKRVLRCSVLRRTNLKVSKFTRSRFRRNGYLYNRAQGLLIGRVDSAGLAVEERAAGIMSERSMLLLPGARLGPKLLLLGVRKLLRCFEGVCSQKKKNATGRMGTSATRRVVSLPQKVGSDDLLGNTAAGGTTNAFGNMLVVLLALPDKRILRSRGGHFCSNERCLLTQKEVDRTACWEMQLQDG